ncbi:MAG: formylmethanofuran dehydrogenase subunit C [Candidatus Bathyarchaeia archaeon]|nr:formylmethanofuran dehydrogenase subunit C [Candidatus Bathyarchaeota archaeon]
MTPKYKFRVPVYAECISPDIFSGKSVEEILALKVWEGNKNRSLGDLFNVSVEKESGEAEVVIYLSGDFIKVRRVGANMTTGKIIVDGDIGMHLGEGMRGGEIIVNGYADSWLGGSMKGGRIEVKGSAGDYIGAPYRGSKDGMKGGTIIIYGDAGREVGCLMMGGLIRIYGSVKHFVGINMVDGTIVIHGDCAGKAGGGMRGGRIIICGHIPSILPTFTIEDIRPSVNVDGEKISGPFYRFVGDVSDKGEGRLFVSKEKNPHLSFYEKYL